MLVNVIDSGGKAFPTQYWADMTLLGVISLTSLGKGCKEHHFANTVPCKENISSSLGPRFCKRRGILQVILWLFSWISFCQTKWHSDIAQPIRSKCKWVN